MEFSLEKESSYRIGNRTLDVSAYGIVLQSTIVSCAWEEMKLGKTVVEKSYMV
jgi:hypothetical protein